PRQRAAAGGRRVPRAHRARHRVPPLARPCRRAPLWVRARSPLIPAPSLVCERRVAALRAVAPDVPALHHNSGRPTVTWIGHSTVLVQLDGVNFLTDPTWAGRSGPFAGFVGVRRYTPPAIAFDDLPRIDFVLISTDH